MIMYEDEHLEAAYEDRYTTAADWDAEDESDYEDDEIDDDEQRDSDEEPAYVGQHRV